MIDLIGVFKSVTSLLGQLDDEKRSVIRKRAQLFDQLGDDIREIADTLEKQSTIDPVSYGKIQVSAKICMEASDDPELSAAAKTVLDGVNRIHGGVPVSPAAINGMRELAGVFKGYARAFLILSEKGKPG
jgi:hypothetical protein